MTRMNGGHINGQTNHVAMEREQQEPDKHVLQNGEARHDDDHHHQATTSAKPTAREFIQTFDFYRFLDPKEPWVLVDEGSFLGYFDWVPRPLRVGPWSVASICYSFAIPYGFCLAMLYYSQDPWASIHHHGNVAVIRGYPGVGTLEWTYNVTVFVWMMYVNYLILLGPLTYRAWSTYTVQSWTLLFVRHGLCIMAPFVDWAARWAEYIRFPVACSATITFVIWNFILMPFIYCIGMKTAEKKRGFLNFCFSFRLLQLHGFNIVFCALNVLWASPPRKLEPLDLLAAIGSVLMYMAWYLLCLDRVGIHLYPVFSPRIGWLVLCAWTSVFFVYLGTFFGWKRILDVMTDGVAV